MIDLSFLTAEEQEIILTVLKRDAELKKTEEQRVQNLQKTVNDRGQLRYLTGKWFYETKQLRHQDRIHGSDIIRASMRHTDKPISILELSQILPEKSSFVSSENKEVFVPPILCGLLLEPHRQLSHEGDENLNISTAPRDISALELQSPTKQRKNPFNSEPSDTCLFDRAVDQTKTQSQEPFPSSNSSISYASSVRQDPSNPVSQHPAVTMAMPEDIAVSTSLLDCSVEEEGSSSRESNSTALQGILKYLSTSNTTDSPFPHLNQQDPVSVDSPAETWIDRKQVSFSTMVSHNGKEWQDEKELGGCSLLDTDSVTSCEIKDSLLNNNDLENSGRRATGTYKLLLRIPNDLQEGELICKNDSDFRDQEAGQHQVHSGVSQQFHQELLSPAGSPLASAEQASGKPAHLEPQLEKDCQSHCKATDGPSRYNTHPPNLPKQSNDISIEATSDPKPSPSGSSNSSSHALLPQPRRKLLEIFRTGREEKSGRVQSCQKEEVKTQQRNQDNTHSISFSATDLTVDKNNAKPSELTEVRKLQLIAVQNTILTEAMITIDTDTQQEATESRDVQFPERLSNLKAFWERENTGPKIIFTREEARQEDISPKEIDISDGHQTYVEKINSLSAQKGHNRSQEDISWPQTECQPFVDLATEDGIYKANPVLIYDEKDYSLTGSLTESQIPEIPCQQVGVSVSAHIKSSVSTPEDRPAKIHDRKHFWESEYTGPRIISVRIREVSGSSVPCNKAVSPQSELKTSLYTKENEGEPQTSPHKPKSTVVLNSSILTDKGFFTESPESSCGTGDIKSTRHQFQVKPDTACEDRPLSLSKFQQLSSKDQANDVRRIPSKTCHPRVLPREPSSPERSRLESSPLKTFPIDIKPQTKAAGEHQGKPTPAPRQRKSPLHGANQTVLPDCKPSTNTTLCALPTSTLPSNSSSFTSPQPKKATEKKLENFTQLARSFIPQDFQYYLRPQEKVNNAPPFHQEKCIAEEIDMPHSPQISIRDLVGNLRDRLAEGNTPRISSWARQKKDENSKQDSTTRAWSLSWASPGSYDDSSSPVMSDVKCLSSRSMSSTKSLENVTSISRDDKTKNISTDQINLVSPLSSSKQIKSNVSLPVLQQDKTNSDSTFESNLDWTKNTGSSTSNISLSSGMASMLSASSSISSLHLADFNDVEVQGSIQFAVNYIQKLGEFHIFVVHCRELAVADTKKNCSDPYVKCYLLPGKTKLGKKKTTVKKKTLNPTYNEILRFKVTMEVLKTQSLNISVWHNNTFGRKSFLGEVDLDLSEWDFSNTQINEYTLKARVSPQTSVLSSPQLIHGRGQMRVALRFLPQASHNKRSSRMETGEVQIWVKDCKNLPSFKGVIIDPFVRCTVLPDTSRKSCQKTRVVKRTVSPMFNHTMVYDGFRIEDLREACVEMTVWDHDRLSSRYIGGLRLGLGTGKSYGVDVPWMDSTIDEAHLWQRMLQSDGEWAEDILPLRGLMMVKCMPK